MVECDSQARTSRMTAALDYFNGQDNSQAVEEAFPGEYSMHYSIYKSDLENKHGQLYANIGIKLELDSPYKEYFKTPEGLPKGADFKNTTLNVIMGNHPDYNVSPSRIMGDDIVRPVEDAFRRYTAELTKQRDAGVFDDLLKNSEEPYYKNEELQGKLEEIQNDTGWLDAMDEAHDAIEEKFGDGQDDERWRYGQQWMDSLQRKQGYEPLYAQMFQKGTKNLVENSVKGKWLISFRHFFDKQRIIYHFGLDNFQKGWEQWQAADKDSGELAKAGIKDSVIYTDKGLDILHPVVEQNKGITYFAAKEYAKQNGFSEGEARTFARSAVEQLQFQYSFVNKPRAMWQGNTRSFLALMNFHLQQRRWQMDLYRQLGDGWKNRNTPQGRANFKNAARVLGLYLAGNALINGVSADLPEEVADVWKFLFPKSYEALRQGDRYSLAGAMNIDLASISRIPLTGVGVLTKVPLFFDKMGKLQEYWQRQVNHPGSVKNLINLTTTGLMFAPSGFGIKGVKAIGNQNLGNAIEYLYRVTTGDYKHYTGKGKVYYSTPTEELWNLIRGKEGLDRQIAKEQLDAQPKQPKGLHIPHLKAVGQ